MSKHTEGQWRYVDGCIYVGELPSRKLLAIPTRPRPPDGQVGPEISSEEWKTLDEEETSNAILMAASKELLEAAQRAATKLDAYVGICKGDKELTGTIIPMLRAAIAKAMREKP